MGKIQTVARILLGLILIASGLNYFFLFWDIQTMPPDALSVFDSIGYLIMYVKMFEMLIGVALIVNRFVPLALLVLAPISFNILAFHLIWYPSGILPGFIVAALNVLLLYMNFDFYKPILSRKVAK